MTPPTRSVLIVDVNTNGHHATYVRWLIESGIESSAQMILASRAEMFAHPEIRACAHRVQKHEIEITAALTKRLTDFSSIGLLRMSVAIGRLYRRAFLRISAVSRVDFVIVPFIDDCLLGLAMSEAFAGTPWMGITMRTMLHYPDVGVIAPPQRFAWLRKLFLRQVLRQKSLKSLLAIDPTLAEFAQRQPQKWMHKISYVPDSANHYPHRLDRSSARLDLAIPTAARLVLIYGEISVRKGIVSLLEAAADPQCPTAIHVLMAGRRIDRPLIESNPAFQQLTAEARLHVMDGYVTSDLEALILAAADCMWVGYTNFYGMSGVMVLAGRHGIPVLASREGLVGYLARKHSIGEIIEPQNKATVIRALAKLAVDHDFFVRAGTNGALLFDRHHPEEFRKIVRQKLESSMPLAE